MRFPSLPTTGGGFRHGLPCVATGCMFIWIVNSFHPFHAASLLCRRNCFDFYYFGLCCCFFCLFSPSKHCRFFSAPLDRAFISAFLPAHRNSVSHPQNGGFRWLFRWLVHSFMGDLPRLPYIMSMWLMEAERCARPSKLTHYKKCSRGRIRRRRIIINKCASLVD